jgi:4-hydroxybenzoate polyprenyltransferase
LTQLAEAGSALVQRGAVPLELLKAIRPKDWIKNTFVFAGVVFAYDSLGNPRWLDPVSLLTVLAAFVLFCMAAGAIYLINDVVDIEKERAHPKKRNRPLASGRLSPAIALIAAVVLLCSAVTLAFALDWSIVIADIFTIASGFVLRTIAGALVIDAPITHWLLICMGMLALFLGLAKRRAELVLLQNGASAHRRNLDEYSLPMIAVTILAYSLFTTTAETMPREPFPAMSITVPFVVYAIFRYLYLVHKYGAGFLGINGLWT